MPVNASLRQRSKRSWRKWVLVVAGCFMLAAGWNAVSFFAQLIKVMPQADSGFQWPYYRVVSAQVRTHAARGELIHILVLPNNTGTTHDDFRVHERSALVITFLMQKVFGRLKTVILVPVFPRSEENWHIYTHALDRDVMETEILELGRLDLQLEAMIDDTIAHLTQEGWRVNDRVLMWGFSASGMFVNRFALLHPDRVSGAVVGSPGGWPIAPAAIWKGHCLRYPIGICDVKALTGVEPDLETYKQVPHLFFIGDRDENDCVPFQDCYEEQDRDLIFELFGQTPVERWSMAERIYRSAGVNAEFRLYPGVGHNPMPSLRDSNEFLERVMLDAK